MKAPQGEGSKIRNWSHLPLDILESILKLLSLSDYLQFGRVCTYWRAIVVDAMASRRCLPAPQLPLLLLIGTPDYQINPCFFDLNKQKLINIKRLIYRSEFCCGSFKGWFFMVADPLSREETRFSIKPQSSLGQELSVLPDMAPHDLLDRSHSRIVLPNEAPIVSFNETSIGNLDLSFQFFLLNPVSGHRIMLPPLSSTTPRNNPTEPPFMKIVASSSPDCQDCIIVGLLETSCHLAVCKLVNKCWTMIEVEETMVIIDIEIIGKTLYVLVADEEGESTIFYDLEDANCPILNMLVSLEHKPDQHLGATVSVVGQIEYVIDCDFTYLAKDDISGELLMIRMLVDYACRNDSSLSVRHVLFVDEYVVPPRAKEFRVWKLDICNHQWLELHDLGGNMLFFRGSGSIMISTTSVNGPEEFVKGNCIYLPGFSVEEEIKPLAISRFCLTDKSMQTFCTGDLNDAGLAVALKGGGFWFMPNIF